MAALRGIRGPRVGLQERITDPGKCAGGGRREQRVVPGDDQPPRYRRIQPALCRQATRRVDAIALEDAELRREHPSRKLQRTLAGFRSALADDLVRLAADLDCWGNS